MQPGLRAHPHRHGPAQLLASVQAVCASQSLRLTASRQRVFELVVAAGKPIKAYDLLDQLKQENSAAAPPTVYRALSFLLDHGFVHRLESINAFVACYHPEERHTVPFLLCDVCLQATELCQSDAAAQLEEEARRVGFLPGAQSLEVHGVCGPCRERGGRK
jgi:Fur family zinc uptake transcriptional regulator